MATINRSKKRRRIKFIFLWSFIVSICLSAFVYHKELFRIGYKMYRVFHNKAYPGHFRKGIIDYPEGFAIHGIDVSRWQDNIDWSNLKSITGDGDTLKFHFAFIKATEGMWLEDPVFKDNWKNARKNKIIRGAYHYFLPNTDARLQAANFTSSVSLQSGDLPPVVDIEETNGKNKKEIVTGLRIFLTKLENRYKVKPLIYSNINFIEDYLSDDFSGYKFWVAHYYQDKLRTEKSLNWLFWQHNDRAGIFGCSYPVDVNVFKGNMSDLKKLLIK